MRTSIGVMSGLMLATLLAGPAAAQRNEGIDRAGGSGVGYGEAIDAAILSNVSRDRKDERDAKRMPYASPGYGPIATARAAADACAADALREAGRSARLAGAPVARTMATGWEVEGAVDQGRGTEPAPFVCSVRNGSFSGLIFR